MGKNSHKGTKAQRITKKNFFYKKTWCLGVLVAKKGDKNVWKYI
jgi:hypothetical protein